jgi:membrane protease YdiL (CAAX protease family)
VISPEDPAAPLILGLVFLALVVALAVRAVRKGRREYSRFKSYTETLDRQRMFRRWLRDSVTWFGGSTIVVLLLSAQFISPMLEQVRRTGWVAAVRERFAESDLGVAVVIGIVVVALGGGILAIVLARKTETVATVGDIAALLPRNRVELGYGAALSVNAGIVEELLFRLGLTALVFGVTGDAWIAIGISLAVFGLLHVYQGIAGVIGSTVIGAVLMALYLGTGSIVAAIVVHALIDLRSLVLIPMVVSGVHRVPGTVTGRASEKQAGEEQAGEER